MANSITTISKYVQKMDEVYSQASKTMAFEVPQNDVVATKDAKTVLVQKLTLDGLSDYSRSTGYSDGDADLTWSSFTMRKDRGKKFQLDTLDGIESYLQIAKVAGEFIRTKVVPEVDLYRFTQIAGSASITNTATPVADTSIELIDTAIATLGDADVNMDNLVLYVSETFYKLMKQSSDVSRWFNISAPGTSMNRNIEMFDGIQVVRVPKTRFSTTATFGDGSNTQTGSYIDFILMDKSSAFAVKKHEDVKIIPAIANQSGDGDLFFYRLYHDCFVYENKVNGIYVNASTAV